MAVSTREDESAEELGAAGITDDLRDARPALDLVAMDEVRARAQRRLFGSAEPPRLGRFVLLRSLAGGGMGVIHRAYDPQLERPVALKLVHPRLHGTPAARSRLLAEARVLARLSHPNVVPVHEVIELEDQVVMVMELVEGKTLAEWERVKRRTWREVVEVYIQAGRGLAAAHALGIVHRDFKPANAIIGDDGRVRVLDFGLATFFTSDAASASADLPATTPSAVPASGPTEPGELLGTLAYMAPEQLSGAPATVASDQFSFCVALYGALYRAPPFAGRDAEELRTSLRAQRHSPPRSAEPAWLRAAVLRGLSYDPQNRHASLAALLERLELERRRRRWSGVFAAAGVLLAAVAGGQLLRAPEDPLAACDGGAEELGKIWSPTRQRSLSDVLARIGTPYSRAVLQPVSTALSSYGARWSALHRAACREHRKGALPEARFERRMSCLDERLAEMRTAIAVLHLTDASNVAHAPDVAAHLAPVEPCAELDALPPRQAPPRYEAARAQLETARAHARQAEALERAGLSERALHSAELATLAAAQTSYPPAIIEAELTKGHVLVAQYRFREAVASLRRAQDLALAQGDLRSAVIAAARRLYAEGLSGADLELLKGTEAVIEPLSRGLQSDHLARPLLLNYLGVLRMVQGERDGARRSFKEAHDALIGVDHPDLELNAIYMNLAMLTSDRFERESTAEHAWARYREELGPQHPIALAEQCRYAQYVDDPETAFELASAATELYRRYHPARLRERAECASHLAFLASELGRRELSLRLYAEVEGLAEQTDEVEVEMRALLAKGYRLLAEGAPRASAQHFAAALARHGGSDHWWDLLPLGDAHLGAGLSAETAGDDLTATAHLTSAAVTLAAATAHNEDVLPRRRLALARYRLSTILQRLGLVDRAAALRARASAFYREANATAYQPRLGQASSP